MWYSRNRLHSIFFALCAVATIAASEPAMAAKCQVYGVWYDYSDPICKMKPEDALKESDRRRTGQSSTTPPRSTNPSQAAQSKNPVCELSRNKVHGDLKESLLARYQNYAAVEMLLNSGMESYDKLCALRVDNVDVEILGRLLGRYYPNISTVEMLHKSERESYDRLKK